jgi:HSP20 family molecular chaperone IbpA
MKRTASKKSRGANLRFVLDSDIDYEEVGILSDFINWQPLYNLYTTPGGLIVHLELPGVDLQDVVIYLRSRYMIVNGSRTTPSWLSGDFCVFHSLEIPYGHFSRRIDFPIPIEVRKYQYEIQNGILTLYFQASKEKIIPVEGD